jgi:hypothetical protein
LENKPVDNRPLQSEAPEWVRALGEEFCKEKLDPIFRELWERAKTEAAAEVERGEFNADEAENNALSAFGQVTSYGVLLQALKLAETKDCPVRLAANVAMEDVALRIRSTIVATETTYAGGVGNA